MVIAVALDSREGDPLPWIEAASPSYPCLIDRDHRLAELYHMVNVPQAVWIDERGTIVRPTEPAGAYEGFRRMDRVTREVPADVARITADAKAIYLNAIRDWVRRGQASDARLRRGACPGARAAAHRGRGAGARPLQARAAPDPTRTGGRGRPLAAARRVACIRTPGRSGVSAPA